MMIFVMAAAVVTFAALLFLIGYILIKGVPHLKPSLFELHYTTENVSMLPAIINTIIMTVVSLVIAIPLGLFTAIYLVEYSGKNSSKIVKIIRLTTETLSGIPSIVYGLFGMLFFVTYLHWGYSILAGAFTMSIMILPLIMRTAEEALLSVSDSFREASFGLGAGKLRTIFRIVLPCGYAGCCSWYNPCYRTNSRRNSRTYVYCRYCCRDSEKPDVIGKNSCLAHVRTLK